MDSIKKVKSNGEIEPKVTKGKNDAVVDEKEDSQESFANDDFSRIHLSATDLKKFVKEIDKRLPFFFGVKPTTNKRITAEKIIPTSELIKNYKELNNFLYTNTHA